jgi:hypothetical protein
MRKGIEVRLGPGDRERLEAVIGSGNSPQKHVWRAARQSGCEDSVNLDEKVSPDA